MDFSEVDFVLLGVFADSDLDWLVVLVVPEIRALLVVVLPVADNHDKGPSEEEPREFVCLVAAIGADVLVIRDRDHVSFSRGGGGASPLIMRGASGTSPRLPWLGR